MKLFAQEQPKPTDTFTLQIYKSGSGSGTVEGAGTFLYQTIVTPTAIANAGSVFTGWEPVSCGEPFPLIEDTICTANFDISEPYGDVDPNSWAAGYINAIRDAGITGGCGDGNYCPQGLVTREQMAAFLVRAVEGEPAANYCDGSSYFSDVSPDAWSCRYIQRLSELNITGGCGGGNYCPQGLVTREQMAAFIVRAVEGEPALDYCGGVAPFLDVAPSTFFCRYIKRLVELGVTQGCGNGNYCPGNEVTREQMAAFLARAFLDMD